MSIQDQVDRLIDERPGRELLNPDYDEKAVPLCEFIFRSAGTSASYMVVAGSERVIVNTGMGWEAPHHKHLFDALHPGPTSTIITTRAPPRWRTTLRYPDLGGAARAFRRNRAGF